MLLWGPSWLSTPLRRAKKRKLRAQPSADESVKRSPVFAFSLCFRNADAKRTQQFQVFSKSEYYVFATGANKRIEAGSKLVRSWFEAGRRPALKLSATSFEPASNQLG